MNDCSTDRHTCTQDKIGFVKNLVTSIVSGIGQSDATVVLKLQLLHPVLALAVLQPGSEEFESMAARVSTLVRDGRWRMRAVKLVREVMKSIRSAAASLTAADFDETMQRLRALCMLLFESPSALLGSPADLHSVMQVPSLVEHITKSAKSVDSWDKSASLWSYELALLAPGGASLAQRPTSIVPFSSFWRRLLCPVSYAEALSVRVAIAADLCRHWFGSAWASKLLDLTLSCFIRLPLSYQQSPDVGLAETTRGLSLLLVMRYVNISAGNLAVVWRQQLLETLQELSKMETPECVLNRLHGEVFNEIRSSLRLGEAWLQQHRDAFVLSDEFLPASVCEDVRHLIWTFAGDDLFAVEHLYLMRPLHQKRNVAWQTVCHMAPQELALVRSARIGFANWES